MKPLLFTTLFILTIAFAPASFATTYYVATPANGGSDSNNGSSGSPWATLQHAVDSIANGDTIIVRAGNFAGCRIQNSGASGAVKTLQSETVNGAVINATGASCSHGSRIEIENYSGTPSYWVIDGFMVNGTGQTAGYGIDLRQTDHITVKNCTIHHAHATGCMSGFSDNVLVQGNTSYSNGEHGFYNANSADYGTIRGNTSYSNTTCGYHHNADVSMGGDGVMSYWLSEKNTAYSNPGAAFNLDGMCDSKFINNLAYKNSHLGIVMFQDGGSVPASRDLIYNNTIYFTTAGYWCVQATSGSTDDKIKNNILIQERASYGSVCTWSTSMGSNFECDYNVVVDKFSCNDDASVITFANWKTQTGWDTHSYLSNAATEFVNAASNDYHLKAGALAIDHGTTLADVTADRDGNSRPQNSVYDIGCYELVGGSPLTITTSSLPADTVGVAYNQTLAATGGTTPYTWAISSGSLPTGLSLNTSSGAITGTPSASGTSNFTARVTDNVAATATKALSIVVNAAISITTSSLPADTVGVAYNQTLASTGGTGAKTWTLNAGSLPAGLSLNSSTGAITGTPTTSGTSNFTAKATDTVGASATKALSIVINAAISITTSSLPADTISVAYNQTLSATGGTGALTWSLNAGTLPTGLSLTSGGVISGTPTASGTSNFTVRATDTLTASATKALSIVVNAAISITTSSLPADTVGIAYNQTLARTGGTTPFTWALASGSLPTGLSLVASTGAITGTPTTSGTSSFTARVTDNVGATATKALSIVVNAAPSITTSSLPGGSVGVAYSQTMTATGGTTPLTWAISSGSLPAGLSLVTSTGAITGTPTTSGTSNFTARVTDNVGATATKALSIVVTQGLTITTSSLPADTVGIAYNQTLAAAGGSTPYTWAIASGTLPTGLSLVAGTGAITGTPTASGTSNFTARVTDNAAATATKALSIVVNAAVTITTASLPNGTVGTAYNQTLAATGGTGSLTWSLSAGSLPAGLSLNSSTGAITGTPTASGTSNFTARATDTVGATGTRALSIIITSGGTGATYQFVSTDSESSTTSTTYQTKATLTFAPNAADDWIILGFAEIKESSTSYQARAQMVVDGVTEGQMIARPKATSDYMSMAALKFVNLSAASHTITIQYSTSNASGTAYVRYARIVALRKSGLSFYQTASDSTTAITTTLTPYATLTFTPAATNDYLYIWSAEVSANTSYYTQLQTNYDGGYYDNGLITAVNNGDYTTFMSFGMFTPDTTSHTATITAAKQSGSGATHNIRRARIVAIQLTGGRFQNYYGGASDSESTTTSTTFVMKKSVTWPQGQNGNWLLLNSARMGNAFTSYSTEVRSYLNSSITSAQSLRQPKAASDYLNFTSIDVRNITTTRTQETDYRTTNASGTAKIRYARLYELPLD